MNYKDTHIMPNWINNYGRYIALAIISSRSNYAYLGDVLSRQLFLAVILYIFLRLWKMTYLHCGVEHMAGLSLPQMLWYLGVTEAITLSSSPVSTIVDEEVRTGSIAIQLIRPIPYPLYRLALYLGERFVRLTCNLAVGALLCLILVKEMPIAPLGFLALAIALPLAIVLDFLGNFLVGLGAFWLENTSGILFIYSRLTMILGGMLIPLDLLPEPYAGFAKSLPFASMVYGPAKQFVHPSYKELLPMLGLQTFWILVFAMIVWHVYLLALKRIAANGG